MELLLAEVPGLKNAKGEPFPKWGCFAAPDVAAAMIRLEADTGGLLYNDIWRPASISLWAMKQKSGVQPPGYSAHNYGLSFDLAVDETLAAKKWTYAQLLTLFEEHGWFCHRRDGKRGGEDWHFNYLGPDAGKYTPLAVLNAPITWSFPVEERTKERYGQWFTLGPIDIQVMLARLKMYPGAIDGILGHLTEQGLRAFQRAWSLPETGLADSRTQRTLAFVSADRKNVSPG